MSEFNPGETANIISLPGGPYAVTVVAPYRSDTYQVRTEQGIEFVIDRRVLVPVDDPSKDPVGTIRGAGQSYVRAVGHEDIEPWLCVSTSHAGSWWTNDEVKEVPVIGAVPGTPAAEKQAEQERPPWTGDGSEEPPAHVKKVRNGGGDILAREGSGWRNLTLGTPVAWGGYYPPYTEARG